MSVVEYLAAAALAWLIGFIPLFEIYVAIPVGLAAGLPDEIVWRHPFPGPGLGVRVLGEVTSEYVDLLQRADHIFIEELMAADLYDRTSQAFAVFLPVRSVGVVGDARRYEYVDGGGEIGFISSVTEPFCGDCTRARITAEGLFYTCLFSADGAVLRDRMREGLGEDALVEIVREIWSQRTDRYSEQRSYLPQRRPHIEMYRMGG